MIEDNEGDAFLVKSMLESRAADLPTTLFHSSSLLDAIQQANTNRPDIALIDLHLPDSHGLGTIERFTSVLPNLPFVVLTTEDDPKTGIEVLREGAEDYLLKGELNARTLVRTIRYALTRHEAEEKKRHSELLLAEAQQTAHIGSWEWDVQADRITWSHELYRIYGVKKEDFLASYDGFLQLIHPADVDYVKETIGNSFATLTPFSFDHRIIRPNGEVRWLHGTGKTIAGASGEVIRMFGTAQDITERKNAENLRRELEEQLRHSQKMEAIGRLAGGIAHDFNNILMAISAYCDLISLRLPASGSVQQDLNEIRRAAGRGASLTQQLLAFSRKQVLSSKVLDLNAELAKMNDMVSRLLGDDIDLIMIPGDSICKISIDPNQLEQVLINLTANARSAMPRGGKLIVETSKIVVGPSSEKPYPDCVNGEYVVLTVTDNGCGMDTETVARIFEPFFTTKDIGKGTGLGLATVYGIIKQSHGQISVSSELGSGTSFNIYLPKADEDFVEHRDSVAEKEEEHLGETILLVDDNSAARAAMVRILEFYGYKVLDARDPIAAIDLCEHFPAEVHVLITDIMMPKMRGPQLARLLKQDRPHMQVLYLSGSTADVAGEEGILEPNSTFLQKPVTKDALLKEIRKLLREDYTP